MIGGPFSEHFCIFYVSGAMIVVVLVYRNIFQVYPKCFVTVISDRFSEQFLHYPNFSRRIVAVVLTFTRYMYNTAV